MDKRLAKRHKRQVQRAKERVTVSEPDVRTPEEVKAAQEASRPAGGWKNGPLSSFASSSGRQGGASTDSGSKGDR